jgi:hypothetical protein
LCHIPLARDGINGVEILYEEPVTNEVGIHERTVRFVVDG